MIWWNLLLWFTYCASAMAEYKPKVTFMTDADSKDEVEYARFDDSSVVLRFTPKGKHVLHRSVNDGETWDSVELPAFKGTPNPYMENSPLQISDNFRDSIAHVFITTDEEIARFSTFDQGKSWKRLNFRTVDEGDDLFDVSPDSDDKFENQLFTELLIHPTDKKSQIYKVLKVQPTDNEFTLKQYSFASTDGINFKELEPPSKQKNRDASFNLDCSFIFKRKISKLDHFKNDVLCLETRTTHHDELQKESTTKFFITTKSFGKFKPFAQELENYSPGQALITDSYFYILTLLDKMNPDSPGRLWKVHDGNTNQIEEVLIPTQIRKSFTMLDEIDGRAILSVMSEARNDSKESDNQDDSKSHQFTKISTELLISDSYGKHFEIPGFTKDASMVSLLTSSSLKKTMFAQWTQNFESFGFDGMNSKVSFDLGRNWNKLKVTDPSKKWEYPCDISDDSNNCGFKPFFIGYDRGSALSDNFFTPGILTGVGAVYEDGVPLDMVGWGTFVSRDDGNSWSKVLDFPCEVLTGNFGNIILAVPFDPEADNDPLSEFYYSLDQGETFQEYQLDKSFFPQDLIPSASDGSGSSFILSGVNTEEGSSVVQYVSYLIEFSTAFGGRKCEAADMEEWNYSDGACLDGVRTKFKRRKLEAKCLVDRTQYQGSNRLTEEICECSDIDYECSEYYSRNSEGKCVPDFSRPALQQKCADEKEVSVPSIKRSKTSRCKNALVIESPKLSCSKIPAPSTIKVSENKFNSLLRSYQYFKTFTEESLLFMTANHEAFVSHDGGENIKKVLPNGEAIIEINFNEFFNTTAYLFGKDKKLYTTHDRGVSFKSTDLPEGRQLGLPLSFSSKSLDTFIYHGGKGCESLFDTKCHSVAYITSDGGKSFHQLLDGALNCEFLDSAISNPAVANGIVCLVKNKATGKKSFLFSQDNFVTQKVLYDDVLGFMSTGDYIVVAVSYGEGELRAYLTIDGVRYSEAILPQDLKSFEQKAFTVLGSQEGAIFMHMTTSLDRNKEFGALLKSNSEGSSFVILERAVNRNDKGFVDFEKIQGLEGIILINTVTNAQSILEDKSGAVKKQIKSKITFNDGADWSYIKPPAVDSEGKRYNCNSKNLQKCSLNVHGFTERKDIRDTYSSGSALGYMFALGNVGEHLLPVSEASTFMTSDGGVTWKEVKKGTYQWEYGDQGSVLALVKDTDPTDTITYSLDGGKNWEDFKFTSEEIIIDDLITVPYDSAMRFLLIGSSISLNGRETKTFTIDFAGSFNKQCHYTGRDDTDFEYVSITHPKSNECLFGHKAQYLRKKSDDCYIGMAPLKDSFKITSNCTCTRNDYECDFNFARVSDGTCKLINGLSPIDPKSICEKDKSLIEYFEPSGYRKIPLSTCQGGLKLDNSDSPKACPGKEKEFKEKYKVKHTSFLLIWVLILLILSAFFSFIYVRGIRRNGGFELFGEIRLGDDDLIEENTTDRIVNTIIRKGVLVFSNTTSGLQLFGHYIGNFFKKGLSRFRNRSGPSYQSLLHDQFLDDADDLLAGHDEDADDLSVFIDTDENFEIGADDEQVDLSAEVPTHEPYRDDAGEASDS